MKALKCLFVGLLVLSITMFAVTGAGATQPNPDPGHIKVISADHIDVYPRCLHVPFPPKDGEYRDITNIQWAVDSVAENGTVKLMTTDPDDNELKAFFFGDPKIAGAADYVLITRGVTIIGEMLGSDASFAIPGGGTIISDRAAIYGGGAVFVEGVEQTSYVRGVLSVVAEAKVVIQDIRFDSFGGTAIHVRTCNDAEIRNNVIKNAWPIRQKAGGEDYNFTFGIQLNNCSTDYTLPNPLGVQEGNLMGDIIIEANKIDLFGESDPVDLPATFGSGIQVGDTNSEPEVFIKNNEIRNPGLTAVLLVGYPNVEVWMTGNSIYQRSGGIAPFGWGRGVLSVPHAFPRGIGITHIEGNHFYDLIAKGGAYFNAAIFLQRAPGYVGKGYLGENTIKNNTITAKGDPTTPHVVMLLHISDAEVSGNTITLTGGNISAGVITLYNVRPDLIGGINDTVENNTISIADGSAAANAIYLAAAKACNISNNIITGTVNNAIRLDVGQGPIGSLFGSTDNTISIQPGNLDGVILGSNHLYLSAASDNNTVYLNGVTGLTIENLGSGNVIIP